MQFQKFFNTYSTRFFLKKNAISTTTKDCWNLLKKIKIYSARVILTSLMGLSVSALASTENITIFPAMGEIGLDSKYHQALSNIATIKSFDNKPFYEVNDASLLMSNRNLILHALKLGQFSNEQFLAVINSEEATFNLIKGKLENLKLSKHLTDILGSALWLDYIDSVFGDKEISREAVLSMLLKFILEREVIKDTLIKGTILHTATYDLFVKTVPGSSRILFQIFPASGVIDKTTVTQGMSKGVIKGAGIVLSIWEAGLDAGVFLNASAGIYTVSKANNASKIAALSTSFLYDFINVYSGDIAQLKTDIEKYSVSNTGIIFRKIEVHEGSAGGNPINLTSFFDVFYYHTLLAINKINLYDMELYEFDDQVVLIKAARLALDYIEKHGDGGNFRALATYKLKVSTNVQKVNKNISIVDSHDFNPLYFMPELDSFDSDFKAHQFLIGIGPFPQEMETVNPKLNVQLNSSEISALKPIKTLLGQGDFNEKEELIQFKVQPVITLTVDYRLEKYSSRLFKRFQASIAINDFFLGYGFYPEMLSSKYPIGLNSFVAFYNQGLIDTQSKIYSPYIYASAQFLIDGVINFVSKDKEEYLLRNILRTWDVYQNNVLNTEYEDLFAYPEEAVTRDRLAKFLIYFFDLDKLKPLRGFNHHSEGDWTSDGITLYQLGILNGDSQGDMNPNDNVSQMEVMLIAERLKELL